MKACCSEQLLVLYLEKHLSNCEAETWLGKSSIFFHSNYYVFDVEFQLLFLTGTEQQNYAALLGCSS